MKKRWHIALLCGLLLAGCTPAPAPEPGLPPQPAHFVKLTAQTGNPSTAAGVALGRQLFFDPILSADSSISCSSCHLPERAFTDGRAIAVGIAERTGRRNAPSLANLAWANTGLFWDGRSESLEAQALLPVTDPNEMGSDWDVIEQRLRAQPHYLAAFRDAFGIRQPGQLTRNLAAKAIAQFERSLVSADSKYDRAMRGEAQLSDLETRGMHIFFDSAAELPDGECGHCHTPPLFTDLTYMNNGLQQEAGSFEYPDAGRGEFTGVRYDNGRFRVPSLRNVALTAPYMHDGSLATLEAVVEHYSSGGHSGRNVDPKIRNLQLDEEDKAALVAFLHTLTDSAFLLNKLPEQKLLQ